MHNQDQYPANWRALARACKERAGWKCEKCGIAHGTWRVSLWTGNRYQVWMQAAHVNHDKSNPAPVLACVCASCHWHHYRKHNQLPAWYIEKLKHRKLIQLAYAS